MSMLRCSNVAQTRSFDKGGAQTPL